jgi:hypothetical protein
MKATLVRTQRSDAQVVERTSMATPIPPLGTLTELNDLLMQHARQASLVAIAAGGIKAEWLSFADQAPAQLGPTAREIISQIGRIRSNLIAEVDQVGAILRNINAAAGTLRDLQALLSHLRIVGGIMPPEENEATLRSVPLDGHAHTPVGVPGVPFQVRIPPYECLRLAAKGKRALEPSDVIALLSESVEAERARIKQLGDVIDTLTQALFSSANVRTADTVLLIERFNHVRLQQQGELRRSLGLLHQMVSPRAGSVSIQAVEIDADEASVELGGKGKKSW